MVQSLALLHADGDLTLLVDPGRIPQGFAQHVGEGVTVVPEAESAAALAALRGCTVLADPDSANAWTQLTLEQSGAELLPGQDPVLLAKAAKNEVEIEGSRQAHLRDAVAEVRFLAATDEAIRLGNPILGNIVMIGAVSGLGVLPIDRELFEYLGNTSLSGAYAMVRSDCAVNKVDELASNMTYMELSTNPRYMDEFVAACFLPHTSRELFPSSIQE